MINEEVRCKVTVREKKSDRVDRRVMKECGVTGLKNVESDMG